MDIFNIITTPSTSRSEIYLYEENGKWFAHEYSAPLLQDLCPETTTQKRPAHLLLSAMQKKVEVDLNELLAMHWFIALCSDEEILLIKTD